MKSLVIAGGVPQIELIKQLKARGIETLLADGSPNAVARPYCDKFYHVDVFDIEAIKDIAVTEKVDFLITVCADQVLLVVAKVMDLVIMYGVMLMHQFLLDKKLVLVVY